MPERELDLDQDVGFQERSWRVQRTLLVFLVLVLIASLLGLFGPGVLGMSTAGDKNGPLWIEYNRFGRIDAENDELRVHLSPAAVSGDRVRIWLGRKYLEDAELRTVTPEPEAVEAGPDRYTFVFKAAAVQQSIAVTFHLEPSKPGTLKGEVGLERGPALTFREFIYP